MLYFVRLYIITLMCSFIGFVTRTEGILSRAVKDMKIKSYYPESGSTTIKAGGNLDLWCNVDRNWEWCTFIHRPSAKFCHFHGEKVHGCQMAIAEFLES